MKSKSLFGILLGITMIPFVSFGQQASGTIDYSVTMQGRSFHRPGSDQQDSPPRSFTMKRQLTFNTTAGKFAAPESDRNSRRGRGFGAEFINFQNKEFIRAFKRRDNDTTFYIAQPFKEAESFTLTGKTKELLGYNCQEATAQLRNGKATLWFTKDLPFTFSPVNGLVPPNGGVVLDLKNNRMHYQATQVQLKAVDAASVAIPEPSHQLSREELEKTRQRMRGGRGQRGAHRRN